VSQYQKGKTNLDFTEAMAVASAGPYASLETDNHASTRPLSFFTGRIHFLPSYQQRQSTESNAKKQENPNKTHVDVEYFDEVLQCFLYILRDLGDRE